MPETKNENQFDTQEPENLDQTDFIENSSFAFQEGDIFPSNKDIEDLLLGERKAPGTKNKAKAKLLPGWMLLMLGGFGFLILLIIILAIVLAFRGNGNGFQSNGQKPEQTINQKNLEIMEERILAIETLEDTLVLPQSRELIIP